MAKKKKKVGSLIGKIFVWLALILMVGSVIIGVISPILR